jgi:hypothetical protein
LLPEVAVERKPPNMLPGCKSIDKWLGSAIIKPSRVPVYYMEELLVKKQFSGSAYAVVIHVLEEAA